MARVYLHSGGLTPTTVRAGTGGLKSSQWRTRIGPWAPTVPATAGRAGCGKCKQDRALVAKAEKVLAEHKQPPLGSKTPVVPGAPGSAIRRKALNAKGRVEACKCRTVPAPAVKKVAGAKGKQVAPVATKSPVKRGLGAARQRLAASDPYQQVLAHDRIRELEQRKKR